MISPSPKSRTLIFRVAAVVVGLSPLLLAELTLRQFDVGNPRDYGDPFVGFREGRPLFVLNQANDEYEIASNRQAFFRPDSFSRVKGEREFRIFCLGGSTVQGRPFAIETSFTTWLELSLQAADPSRTWQVVNCGGVSYASYRLVPILQEVLGYEPDLVILYTGHNEFLESRTYGDIKSQSRPLAYALSAASQLRTFTLVREGFLALAGNAPAPEDVRPILSEEVEALLDYRGGLEHYHRDEAWRRGVIAHYRYNVRRMVRMSLDRGVPIWLADPVCNLRDCPPFKSEHRDGLTPDELERWDALRRDARAHYGTDLRKSVELMKQALDIDGQYAGLYYDLAKCYEGLGMMSSARAAYIRSKELDVCPLRIVEAMNQSVHDIAEETGVSLIPVREAFDHRSREGIPGSYLLVDHVHPSIPGHKLIAELIMEAFISRGLVAPVEGWTQHRDDRFAAHMKTLDDWYYLQGYRRLENLRAWAQGRSTLEPPGGGPETERTSPGVEHAREEPPPGAATKS